MTSKLTSVFVVRFLASLVICARSTNVTSSGPFSEVQLSDSLSLLNDPRSVCSENPWSSCVGRCGNNGPSGVSIGRSYVTTCACDRQCEFYQDCCANYGEECELTEDDQLQDDRRETQTNTTYRLRFSCVSNVAAGSILMIDECSPTWSVETIERQMCKSMQEPPVSALDVDGRSLVFRNVHCARCNGFDKTVQWGTLRSCADCKEFTAIPPPGTSVRGCHFDVGDCPVESAFVNVSAQCSEYSEPVSTIDSEGGRITYKNVHCARCNNGHQDDEHAVVHCPTWNFWTGRMASNYDAHHYSTSLQRQLHQTSGDNRIRPRTLRDDIPASFTILFTFSTDGTMKTMFDSQQLDLWSLTKANCKDLEIWEPFSKKCRRLYCSSHFVLVDFKCVKVYDNSSVGQGTEVTVANLTDNHLLWQNTSQVLVTLYLELAQPVSANVSVRLHAGFLRELADSLDASYGRFANFSLTLNSTANSTSSPSNDAPNQLVDATVSFLLSEQGPDGSDDGNGTAGGTLSEPTIDKIVASLSSGISLSHFFIHVDGITMHMIGIDEEFVGPTIISPSNGGNNWTATLMSFCDTQNGARMLYYENNDFEVVFTEANSTIDGDERNGVAMDVHVFATDLVYHPGEYLANLVFQGNQMEKEANLSGSVVICDRSSQSDNNNCTRVALPSTDYRLLSNSSLVYVGSDYNLPSVIDGDDYEILSDGTALVCYNVPTGDGDTTPAFGAQSFGERIVNVVLTVVSLVASLLTFVTYAAFADLRTLASGVHVLNLTACLWFFQFVFLLGERQSVVEFHPFLCKMIAVFVHFTALCYFCWMNVVAIDLHRVFASSNSLLKSAGRSRKSTVWKFLYAYGFPTLAVGSCVLLDTIPSFKLGAEYGTHGYCWMGNRTVQLIAFVLPVFLMLASNVVLYVLVAISIRRIQRVTKLATIDNERHQHSVSTGVIFVRLCTILGFTWLLGLAVIVPFGDPALVAVCHYAFIVLNASHGTAIFLAFVCNHKVLLKYLHVMKALFGQLAVVVFVAEHRHRCPHQEAAIRCDQCRSHVTRTRSNETCKSNLSTVYD